MQTPDNIFFPGSPGWSGIQLSNVFNYQEFEHTLHSIGFPKNPVTGEIYFMPRGFPYVTSREFLPLRFLKNMLVKMGSSSPIFGVKISKIFEVSPPRYICLSCTPETSPKTTICHVRSASLSNTPSNGPSKPMS